MRLIGAIFAALLLATPVFAEDKNQGNAGDKEGRDRKEQEKREAEKKREEMKKKEEVRRDEKKEVKDPVADKIRRLVEEQDKDGDGAIGETEAKGDIKAKFGELDSNDDNKVTPEEIGEYIKRRSEEDQKRKHDKQPAPKKDEPRKEEPRKEEPRKDAPRKDEPRKDAPKKEGERPSKG